MSSTALHTALVNGALIKERLLDQLMRHGYPTLVAAQCVALLVFLALSPFSEGGFLTIWIVLFTLVSVVRYIGLIISRDRFKRDNIKPIARYQVLGALLGGTIWSALVFTYNPAQPLFAQLFLLVILVGLPAGSLASNAVYLPAFLAFALPIMGSLVFWALVHTTSFRTEFTIVSVIYAALILIIARQYAANMRNSIERSEENKILVREIKAVNAKLLQLAYKDPLTSLSNRRQFEENAARLLEQLSGTASSMALLLIDVDNFKQVNDTYGHEAGDELLRELSSRIKSSSRESEMIAQVEVARIGGDEFIIVYHLDAKSTGIEALSQRILHEISLPMELAGKTFQPSVSIGIALAPKHAAKIKDLVRVADVAMYQAKKAGGSRAVIATGKIAPFLN
ncbi:MAG: diguanylate cyclase [Chromatiaceae bacterium]|nr:diguanylate cyclase [Chromatiaceae bacterium]